MAEALGTGAIPGELSAILVGRFGAVHKDGKALTPEKRSGQGVPYLLVNIASGVDHIPNLEQVAVIGFDQDGTVHLLHSLLSFPVNLYSASRRLFACWFELPAEGLSPVFDIPHNSFAARCSIHTAPQVDHVTHMGRISPPYW